MGYHAETIVFAVDLDAEANSEAVKGLTRWEAMKQCIGLFAQAKSRANPNHKYGLILLQEAAQWATSVVTGSPEGLMSALRNVQPGSTSYPSLDISSIVQLVAPLTIAEEADGAKVRVVMVYCRSGVLPRWSQRGSGESLAMDAIYLHSASQQQHSGARGGAPVSGSSDSAASSAGQGQGQGGSPLAAPAPAPAPACAGPQQVYSFLEEALDELSTRCGHRSYIFEAKAANIKKLLTQAVWLLAHPAQRAHQASLSLAPHDVALLPPQSIAVTDAAAFPPLAAGAGAAAAGPAAPAPAPLTGAWAAKQQQGAARPPAPAPAPAADRAPAPASPQQQVQMQQQQLPQLQPQQHAHAPPAASALTPPNPSQGQWHHSGSPHPLTQQQQVHTGTPVAGGLPAHALGAAGGLQHGMAQLNLQGAPQPAGQWSAAGIAYAAPAAYMPAMQYQPPYNPQQAAAAAAAVPQPAHYGAPQAVGSSWPMPPMAAASQQQHLYAVQATGAGGVPAPVYSPLAQGQDHAAGAGQQMPAPGLSGVMVNIVEVQQQQQQPAAHHPQQ